MVGDHNVIITVLVGLLGLTSGLGVAWFGILKRINEMDNAIVKNERDIKTLYRDSDNIQKAVDRLIDVHETGLEAIRETINQNNLLIQRITAERR